MNITYFFDKKSKLILFFQEMKNKIFYLGKYSSFNILKIWMLINQYNHNNLKLSKNAIKNKFWNFKDEKLKNDHFGKWKMN